MGHGSRARSLNDLGCVLLDLNDLEGARRGFERALAINEAIYRPDHPQIARNLNNLAFVRYRISIVESAQGPGDPGGAGNGVRGRRSRPGHPAPSTLTHGNRGSHE